MTKLRACESDFFSIPIFIISYNRLHDLKKCISRFEKDGYKNIIILDNASTNQALIDYLHGLNHKVYFLKKNYGHHVLWDCHLFDDFLNKNPYVLTDPDVLPVDECPSDYLKIFYEILIHNPEKSKVGFSLKIDDLPEDYQYKYDIIRFESFYWERKISSEYNFLIYDAPIDTTFALYKPGLIHPKKFYKGIRTGYPYTARHLGWYIGNHNLNREECEYFTKDNKCSTSMNSSFMQGFQLHVIRELASRQNLDICKFFRQIADKKFIQKNADFLSIVKLFVYLILKKIAIILHLR